MRNIKCPLCDSNKNKEIYNVSVNDSSLRYYRFAKNISNKFFLRNYPIVKCEKCEFMYLNPTFNYDQIKEIYSNNSTVGGQWINFWNIYKKPRFKKRNEYSDVFTLIHKYLDNKKAHILDIGCGDGHFLSIAKEKGFKITGLDLNKERINYGISNYNLNHGELIHGTIDQLKIDFKYDVIILFDIIEHVINPIDFLTSVRKLVDNEGLVIILTMSLDSVTYKLFKKRWNYINPTQHLSYFSNNTMKNLLEKTDFRFEGQYMDETKTQNLAHFFIKILVGLFNNVIFNILKPINKILKSDLIENYLQNLYPGIYYGRYHDNFYFVAKPKITN